MTLKFTHHAVERYIQFHMLDSVNPDPRDVRALLESHADQAIKSPVKTHRGDTQWRIEALGCELVSRHDEGVDVVVTILPPLRFRGLTPEQAQILEARVAQAHHEVEGLAADEAHLQESLAHRLIEDLSREWMVAARARREAMRQPLAEARAMRIDAQREHAMIAGVLRTARHQIHTDKDNANIRRALRVALKALRAGAQDPGVSVYEEEWYATVRSALEEIERIDSQLVTNAFIDGTR